MHMAKRSRVAGIAGGALIAIFALAGCGGSSHAASAGTTTTTGPAGGNGARNGAALSAFRSCMSSHGVTLPQRPRGSGNRTPGSSRPRGTGNGGGFGGGGFFNQPPPGVDATKYQSALSACRSTLPTGANFRNNSAFQAYRSCLQDHGVTLPAQGSSGNINRNDPKVKAAMKTCAPLLPQGFGRRSTTTTAPPTS
jgi:hypothetical protein